MSNKLLNDAFIDSLGASIADIDKACTLPPECYTSDEFYEFEKTAVFANDWICVGRESWVTEPGSFFNTIVADEPILISRDLDNQLHAMSSVCQHRAMLVSEGRGVGRGFVCPYHHWVYKLDGSLLRAPEMERACNFDPSKSGLPKFSLEIWCGFIFINFDPDAAALAPRLADINNVVARYDMANAEEIEFYPGTKFPWNWKVMFENNNDGYHANRLHQGHLHDFVPSRLADFPDLREDALGYYRTNGTLHRDASFNATQKALLPLFEDLTDEDRNRMVFANIPPALSLVLTVDSVIFLIVRATGPETHEMDVGILAAKGASTVSGFKQKMAMNAAAAAEIMAQDQHVDELVQVGLRSRFAPRGRYSWQEGAQLAFNRWLVPRYAAAWNKMKTG